MSADRVFSASRTGSPIAKTMLIPQGEPSFVSAAAGTAVATKTISR
jgi:hypothetical protein